MSETFLGDLGSSNPESAAGALADQHAGSSDSSESAGQGPGGSAPGWIAALPEDVRGYVENKGWKEPADLLAGYRQLEEFLGADKAGRGVLLPKDDQDQEALDKIYDALGRPEKAEGYELTALLAKEETDPAFMEAMAATMHGAGLSKAQAQKMAAAYQGHVNASRQAAVQAHQAEVVEAENSISPEEKELCRRGFRFLGLDNRDAAAIEMYWGVKKAAQMFARIGQALGEDSRIEGAAPGGFIGSPAAARSRVAELQADPIFRERYLNGEPEAVKQMEDLYQRIARGDRTP